MKFTYTATTKEGKTVHGTMEATSRDAVMAALNRQGAKPILIKLDGAMSGRRKRAKKVKLKELVVFTRQLSTMVSAGVPLPRSLATLQDQTESKYFKSVISTIIKDVEGGIALGDAFAKYPSVFSDVYVNMVRAGESGGILDEILKRLATQVEQDASMRKKVKSAMTYPMVILAITVFAFFWNYDICNTEDW
jgi:type IV pilus assembly protein PilC